MKFGAQRQTNRLTKLHTGCTCIYDVEFYSSPFARSSPLTVSCCCKRLKGTFTSWWCNIKLISDGVSFTLCLNFHPYKFYIHAQLQVNLITSCFSHQQSITEKAKNQLLIRKTIVRWHDWLCTEHHPDKGVSFVVYSLWTNTNYKVRDPRPLDTPCSWVKMEMQWYLTELNDCFED